jgi:hypothetical protein
LDGGLEPSTYTYSNPELKIIMDRGKPPKSSTKKAPYGSLRGDHSIGCVDEKTWIERPSRIIDVRDNQTR